MATRAGELPTQPPPSERVATSAPGEVDPAALGVGLFEPVPIPHSCELGDGEDLRDDCFRCLKDGHQPSGPRREKQTTTMYTQEQIGEFIAANQQQRKRKERERMDEQDDQLRQIEKDVVRLKQLAAPFTSAEVDSSAIELAAVASSPAASATIDANIPPVPRPSPDLRFGLHFMLLLLALASVVYFVLLPERPLVSQGVYIDENSLLVGSANHQIKDDTKERIAQLEAGRKSSPFTRDWLLTELGQLPLSVSESSFPDVALSTASNADLGPTSVVSALWRAPKGDGKECFVVVAEFDQGARSESQSHHPSVAGVSILLALMRHLTTEGGRAYFHKDVILVFVGSLAHSSVSAKVSPYTLKAKSVEAFGQWMDLYKSGSGLFGDRGGSIMASFTLDIPSTKAYTSFSLDILGFHGLAPNLDTPSVLLKSFDRFGLKMIVAESAVTDLERPLDQAKLKVDPAPFLTKSFYSSLARNEHAGSIVLPAPLSDLFANGRWDMNLARWKGLWRFMIQALQGGSPGSGAFHAHALKYAIDAATVRAVPVPKGSTVTKQDAMRIALQTTQCLETVLRSSNNLVEKLHHSTFFYLLSTTSDFATMSKYIYVAVLALATLPIYAMAMLLIVGVNGNKQRFAATFALLGAIYFVCAAAYLVPGPLIHLVGRGAWNEEAQIAWLLFVGVGLAILAFVVVPRCSLLRQTQNGSLLASGGEIELLREPINLTKAAATKAAAKPVELYVEMASSPPYLPMLPASLVSSMPLWECSLDWRVLQALSCLAACMALVPIMVLHFSACVLTLVFVVPLVLASSATVWPGRWWVAVSNLQDAEGKKLRLGTNLPWEVIKYLLRRSSHLLGLVATSPVALVWLYARFHGLELVVASRSLLDGLAQPQTNILFYTAAFAYAPLYIVSLLQLLVCSFRMHAPPSQHTSQGDSKKTR